MRLSTTQRPDGEDTPPSFHLSRRSFLRGATLAGGAIATEAVAGAPAILTGAGNYRSLSLVNNRTAERINCVYWIEGQYVDEALGAFNHLLRDWREDQVIPIDRRAIDILSATHNLLDCSEPFEVVSGYRSEKTNAMLRRRSRGVARNSYHTKGMAIDLALETRSVTQIARAAMSLGAGGVGRYSRRSFTHIDSGPVRDWGR